MSLLNEALRKRSGESGPRKRPRGLFGTDLKKRHTGRIIVYGIVIPFLAVCFGWMMWVWQGLARSEFFSPIAAVQDVFNRGTIGENQEMNTFNTAEMDSGESQKDRNAASEPPATAGTLPVPAPEETVLTERTPVRAEAVDTRIPEWVAGAETAKSTIAGAEAVQIAAQLATSEPEPAETASSRTVVRNLGPDFKIANKSRVDEPKKKGRPPSLAPKPVAASGTTVPPEENGLSAYYRRAVDYHRQRKFDQAVTMYQEVLQSDPGHLHALFNLASAYIETKDHTRASRILHRMITHEPDNPDVLVNMAIAEMGLDRPESALLYLEEAEQQLGSQLSFDIYLHRAAALCRLGRTKLCLAAYQKAETLAPDKPQVLFNIAVTYDRLGAFSEAVRYYGRYLRTRSEISESEVQKITNRMRWLDIYIAKGSSGEKSKTERPAIPDGS